MRILIVSPSIPFPPIGGDKLRIYHLLRALATRHDVTLVGFTYGDLDYNPTFPTFPVQMVSVPWEWPELYREMEYGDAISSQLAYEKLASETAEPFLVSYFESAVMEKTLRQISQDEFDLVLIEHTYMARFLPALPTHVPKVLDLHNVHTRIAQRATVGKSALEQERANTEADRTLQFEKLVASQCACCLTVSHLEAAAARNLLGIDCVQVLTNGVDTSFFTATEEQPTSGYLLFTGTMNYTPNIEAVQYFTKDILPQIQQEIPEARLHIVGASPTKEVNCLASESVIIHGFVPDIRPYYRNAALVVVPLLHGGGTRLKILEAAASGKAVVSTSLGAEGLEFCSGLDLVVADAASDFADCVINLLRDEVQRRQLEQQARRASKQYDWEKIGSQLCHIVENLTLTQSCRSTTGSCND